VSGRYDNLSGERGCYDRGDCIGGSSGGSPGTGKARQQYDVRYDDLQERVYSAAALPDILEQVPEYQSEGDFEKVRTVAEVCQ
jgi:hypothetical protein